MDRSRAVVIVSEATNCWLRFCFTTFRYMKPNEFKAEVSRMAGLNNTLSKRDGLEVLSYNELLSLAVLIPCIDPASEVYHDAHLWRASIIHKLGLPELA